MSDTQTTYRYEVCLTPDQFQRLHSVDEEWKGSEHYMGLAYFWSYGYRFLLRDATANQRVRVHRGFLDEGLFLDGESFEHRAVLENVFGKEAVLRFTGCGYCDHCGYGGGASGECPFAFDRHPLES